MNKRLRLKKYFNPHELVQPGVWKTVISNGKTYPRFPLDRTEQLYGFGLNFQTVHQRGRILSLYVHHYGCADNGQQRAFSTQSI